MLIVIITILDADLFLLCEVFRVGVSAEGVEMNVALSQSEADYSSELT